MSKWKCEICGNEFENFHAQGFDNKIYCPLCYFKKENQELNQKYLNAVADYETTMFEKEQLNSLVNSCQEEIRRLKKQLQERPKEYVFIGNAQNRTRDFINQIIKDIKEFKNQQKEFIEWITLYVELLNNKPDLIEEREIDLLKEILSKYKEIIGVSDDKTN